ncbi:MAG TPA: hypothetical protein VMC43_00080 [Candidatus Paceibacterota bacterium]|nr:hypothetical protein [Candidatus Paceibacterota bacterium]
MGQRLTRYFLLLGFTAQRALAQGGTGGGGQINITDPLGGKGFSDVAVAVGNFLKALAVPVVVVMVVWGGFQIMTAGGDTSKVKRGRETITYAVIGLAVVVSAQLIIDVVKEVLGGGS